MHTEPPVQREAPDGHTEAARALLARAARDHAPVALASSMSAEDMVLIDLVARDRLAIEVFVLDTGRLHPETQALITRARTRYALSIKVYVPDHEALGEFLSQHGPDAIYDSSQIRKTCCAIRKVAPLRRALAGRGAWITGLRQGQSVTRAALAEEQWDEANGLFKFSPLAAWSRAQVWSYISANRVPYNPLYDQGFASIGCAPCTRAIEPGADQRSGRWWWERPEERECGLHVTDGPMVGNAGQGDETLDRVPGSRS
ncbi:MAG: phosphoadenylyl-sulfate reductase [Alphaproteobacteria bacterium]|nr:phosphoadenylyl-sulfate reductase [Alphaproteobacteria bacterium]